ncbi:MAG TPA: AAA family ATPase [Acetobacteraceae bacterium]|nr:AAA family ATPase [Acetobacteraceae bacterium]
MPASEPTSPLPPDRLYRQADIAALRFETTRELAPLREFADQPRAHEAIRFGTEMAVRGFNIFAIGANGAHIEGSVRALLEDAAVKRPRPSDWVYVNNFTTPYRPVAIALPPGRAPVLDKALDRLIDDLKVSLPAAFESEDYQKRRSAIEQEIRGRNERAFTTVRDKATAKGIAILRTPMGFAMAPMKDGQVVPPAEFNAWPAERQREVQTAIEELEKDLEETLRVLPRSEREQRDAVRALDRDTARFAIAQPIEECKTQFADLPKVVQHLEAIHADILENIALFIAPQPAGDETAARPGSVFDRYQVNVFVTSADGEAGAPVIEEVHPTLSNLVGRIEHLAVQGALVTNFRLIKPGSLHRANGGALMIDLRNLLSEPLSWAALKRALLRQEIVIEDPARFMGMTTTVTLEPDPIPLDVKVVLFGDRMLYYLLVSADPDTAQHFKVLADFDDDIDRSPASETMMARLIGSIAANAGLLPLDRGGVARLIEHAARLADDSTKLTLLVESIHDLVAEASHCAGQAGRDVVTRDCVDQAIAQQRRRASRVEERGREMILRDIALIATGGSSVGQVNGLSVLALAGHAFGRPTRITARVRPGAGRIVDIEREVELGGPLHSKGVLILSGFLAGRYALGVPMSLYASLVFEQSYGGVDGDSASSAELYSLLSALAELPLRQDLAVTGSVDQHGTVQAIGGVNEKIEGFFDVCAARGLTGTQGVLIPHSNAQHLMLRADVVAACAAGRFAVYPVHTIDEGIRLLTGRDAGERGDDGLYPKDNVNRLVEDRLAAFAKARRAFGRDASDGS